MSSNQSKDPDYLFLSHNIELLTSLNQTNHKSCKVKETSTDTNDLINDNTFNFKELKREYINNLISWSFLKKLSDLFQWPLLAFSAFIDNSITHGKSTQIDIDVKCYDKYFYNRLTLATAQTDITAYQQPPTDISLYQQFHDKIIVLNINDNGIGMQSELFNKVLFSFGTSNDYGSDTIDYFYQFGVTLKSACLRLGNSCLIISKTNNEMNIGLISKHLQTKLDTDVILTPIVNYEFNKNEMEYTFKSQYSLQSMNLILNEIRFMFYDTNEIFNYCNSFETGTHLFLYDLNQLTKDPNKLNTLDNFELLFTKETNDILFNLFYKQVKDITCIDCSLRKYLEELYIMNNHTKEVQIKLMDKLITPNTQLIDLYKSYNDIEDKTYIAYIDNSNLSLSITTNANCVNKEYCCCVIKSELYNGVLIRKNKELIKECAFDKYISDCDKIHNGIFLYLNGRLISSLEQCKFGDVSYYLKKKLFKKKNTKHNIINEWVGYIELPMSLYEIANNKTEFKDKTIFAYFYSKVHNLIRKLSHK
jgi:hypothetical protein